MQKRILGRRNLEVAFIGLVRTMAALVILVVPAASASAQDTLRLTRVSGSIVVDGRVDEPVWDRVPVLPLTIAFVSVTLFRA